MPFFSIITPVFNGEKYLARAIQSVLNQNFQDFELILIDDGSTDQSVNIANKFVSEDIRVKLLQQENQGALLARKKGVLYAKGKYHLFLDCDDTFEDGALSEIYQLLQKDDIDLLLFNYYKVDAFGKKKRGDEFLENRKLYKSKDLLLLSINYFGLLNSLCIKAIRADVSKRAFTNYDQNLSMAEDLLISLQVFQNINCAIYINKCYYNYYDNPNSSMHNVQLKFFNEYEFVYDEEMKILDKNNFNDEVKRRLTEKQIITVLARYFFYTFQQNLSLKQFAQVGNMLLKKSYFRKEVRALNLNIIWLPVYTLLQNNHYRMLYAYVHILKIAYCLKHLT